MDSNLPLKRSFVSQDIIDEQRRAREEEWRKTYAKEGEGKEEYRSLEQATPLIEEAPYDPRPLYEKLQEQRQKKEDAFQEATRLANLVHRLDDDEIDFLQSIRSEEKAREQDKQNKEKVELNAFRRAQAVAAESLGPTPITGYDTKEKGGVSDATTLSKSNNEFSSSSSFSFNNKARKAPTDKQRQLLSKVIVRKRPLSAVDSDTTSKNDKQSSNDSVEPPSKQAKQTTTKTTATKTASSSSSSKSALTSLVAYSDDSDNDN